MGPKDIVMSAECDKCPYQDLYLDDVSFESVYGEWTKHYQLHCTHEDVCQRWQDIINIKQSRIDELNDALGDGEDHLEETSKSDYPRAYIEGVTVEDDGIPGYVNITATYEINGRKDKLIEKFKFPTSIELDWGRTSV